MIPQNPQCCCVVSYGSSATYKDPPPDECIASGVIPLDSLPAAWWNWMWNQTNGAINEARTALTSTINEMNTVLCTAGITPNAACFNQLDRAIEKIRQTLATAATAGAVKSSDACGNVTVNNDGTMTVNGLGNVTQLTTSAKNSAVCAINELKAKYDCCVSVLNDCTCGLGSSKAPVMHAVDADTYGVGNATCYGHLKISDQFSSVLTACAGVAASQKAIADVYSCITGAGYTTLGNTAGSALGTASAGSATTAARSDHVHPYTNRLIQCPGCPTCGSRVYAEGGNELTIYPSEGAHAWINYRGGAAYTYIGAGAGCVSCLGTVIAKCFCGTASSAGSATSATTACCAKKIIDPTGCYGPFSLTYSGDITANAYWIVGFNCANTSCLGPVQVACLSVKSATTAESATSATTACCAKASLDPVDNYVTKVYPSYAGAGAACSQITHIAVFSTNYKSGFTLIKDACDSDVVNWLKGKGLNSVSCASCAHQIDLMDCSGWSSEYLYFHGTCQSANACHVWGGVGNNVYPIKTSCLCVKYAASAGSAGSATTATSATSSVCTQSLCWHALVLNTDYTVCNGYAKASHSFFYFGKGNGNAVCHVQTGGMTGIRVDCVSCFIISNTW